MRKKMPFLGIAIVLVIVFIVFYPLQFNLYELLKVKRYVDYVIVPSYAVLVLYDIVRNIRKGEKDWWKYLVDFSTTTAVLAVVYYFLIRGFIAFLLLFINSVLDVTDPVTVQGKVVEIVDIVGTGNSLGTYELVVVQDGKEYVFESNHFTLANYKVGTVFNEEFQRGILGILYKK
ncbi:conserved membrane hypothetical protein [Tenacibaculum litopenaei]|jgi:hypothetical protein|uniref:hypothetical protein n=1 Tax=Tenacibaculum litopenaei TaxID=396016 RepID=UPI0038956AC4